MRGTPVPRSRQVQLHHSLLPRREVPQQTLDYSHEVQVRLHRGPYDQNDGPQDPSQVKDWLAMPKTAQEFDTYRLEQRLRGEGLRNNAQGNLVLALRSQDPRLDLVGLDPSLHLTVARCWTGERPLPG